MSRFRRVGSEWVRVEEEPTSKCEILQRRAFRACDCLRDRRRPSLYILRRWNEWAERVGLVRRPKP